MDTGEARQIAGERIQALRRLSYAQLRDRYLKNSEDVEVVGPSGARYQVETEAVWDDRSAGNLRVLVAVDDGGWRAFVPLTESFIIAPDGTFVGE